MSTDALGADEGVALNLLTALKDDWHTIGVIAEFLEWNVDRTSDALFGLDKKGMIEIDEWEDGLRIRRRHREVPLTPDQQAKVVEHLGLAGEVARRWVLRLQCFYIAEELRQHLQVHLIRVVQKYNPHHYDDEVESGFVSFAWKCLNGSAKRFFEKEKHLKGLNYENKGGLEISTLSEVSEPYYGNPSELWDSQEEIKDMLSVVSPIEQDALLLTDYMEYTGQEVSKIINKSWPSVQRIKREALKKIRSTYTYNESTGGLKRFNDDAPKTLITRRSVYNVTTRPILPRYFVGFDDQWSLGFHGRRMREALGQSIPCPHCTDKVLAALEYCLYCDRWGQDATATTETENRLRKFITMAMAKSHQRPNLNSA